MAIFNSYVSLPEGKAYNCTQTWPMTRHPVPAGSGRSLGEAVKSRHPTDRLWGIDSRLLWLQQKEAGTTWGDGKMVEDGKVPNGISISYRKIIRKYIWVQIELSIHNFGRILPSYHADVGSKSYAPWEKHLVGTCNASRSYNFFIDLNGVL